MNVTSICFGIMFFLVGVAFFLGKAHIHISAWKSMSNSEKSKIKIQPLCRNIGSMIAFCGIIFLINGLWKEFQEYFFVWSMVAWLIISGADVYFIGKSKRYKRE